MNPVQAPADRTHAGTIEELDRVRLMRRTVSDGGAQLDAGSKGTVVSVYGGGEAFCVELIHPVQALVTVGRDDIEAIAEETIARLASSSGPIRR